MTDYEGQHRDKKNRSRGRKEKADPEIDGVALSKKKAVEDPGHTQVFYLSDHKKKKGKK